METTWVWRWVALVAVGYFLLLGGDQLSTLAGAEPPAEKKKAAEEQEPSFWMKQKMTYAQNLLNALVKEDFDQLAKNANAMKGLSAIEYFVRQQPEGYRTQLKTFQFTVDELLRHAEDRNLDGATLAFTQMTISCVNCHKQLRKQ